MQNELEKIETLIYEIRGQKVMFDRDLARLYGVELRSLNQAVKRNIERFPEDFMFQLTAEEWDILRSQIVIAKTTQDEGDNLRSQFVISSLPQNEGDSLRSQIATTNKSIAKVRYLPYVFTEQGIAMLSGLLNSEIAIKVNIQIMRAFVKLRHYVLTQSATTAEMAELRKLLMLHIENNDYKFSEYDETIKQIVHVLNNLIEHPPKTKRIGFGVD